jgi:putative transcriptional regulator
MSKRGVFLVPAAIAAVCMGWAVPAPAADTEKPVMLVAKPELKGSLFESSILLVKPIGGGRHIGFIVNKPTRATLGQLFPEHEPSRKADHPVYLGGPQELNLVFALVERHGGAQADAMQITPELFLAVQETAIDQIIEKESDHARFFVGMVSWAPGELDEEIQRGYWFETEPETKFLLRKKTDGLWDELRRREEDKERVI